MALCPELRINAMQTRFLQNLCSGLALLSSDFSSTHQNDLKPGQCLDIHDITPFRILQLVLYFKDRHLQTQSRRY